MRLPLYKVLIACLLSAFNAGLLIAAEGQEPAPAKPASPEQTQQSGSQLEWVELSLGGQLMQVMNGGIVTVHPDVPFKVIKIQTSSWFDLGLHAEMPELPQADLDRFNTLSQLLGQDVFKYDHLDMIFLKGDRRLGSIRLIIRLLPIDLIRQAEASPDIKQKIQLLYRAHEQIPDDRLLLKRLTELMLEDQQYTQVIALLEHAPEQDIEILTLLAELHQALGNHQQTIRYLDLLLDKNPVNPELWEQLAQLYEDDAQWAKAAQAWEKYSQLIPQDARGPIWARIGRDLLRSNDQTLLPNAIQALEEALKSLPQDPQIWQDLARAHEKSGNKAGVSQAKRRALALLPHDQNLHLEVIDDLLAEDKKSEAAAELEKLLAINPDMPALWLRLAQLQEELQNIPGQIAAYTQLARLEPDNSDLRYNLALLLRQQNQPDQAKVFLEEALKLNPQDQESRYLLYEIEAAAGQWDKAAATAGQLLKNNPRNLDLWKRTFSDLMKTQPKAMAELLDNYSPDNLPLLYEMRATLALEQNDTATAIKVLEKAAKAMPENLAVLYRLALLYEATDQESLALKRYEAILDKNPEHEGAQERYLQLKTRLLEGGSPK